MEVDKSQNVYRDLLKSHVGPKCYWRFKAKEIRKAIVGERQTLACDRTPINPYRGSGMMAFLRTYRDIGHYCTYSIHRVLFDFEKDGGLSFGFAR